MDLSQLLSALINTDTVNGISQTTDTSAPGADREIYESFKEKKDHCQEAINDIGEKAISDLKKEAEDNPMFGYIQAPVKALYEAIVKGFEGLDVVIDQAMGDSESIKSQKDQDVDEAADVASQTTATADQLAASLKLFDNI